MDILSKLGQRQKFPFDDDNILAPDIILESEASVQSFFN